MDSSIEDIEFLARSAHRVEALAALADGPRDRADLRAECGASSPTIGRVIRDFEARRWISRNGPRYELTPLGTFVAERFASLREAMATERKLRDVWRWLPREMEGFSVELFADAVVSYPGPGYPYEPVARVTQLVEETEAMRAFGTTEFKSINLDTVCDAVLDGMEYECIYAPAVLETVLSWNPERVTEAAACENCTILVHESLPDDDRCGIGIYDDRMGICCHDRETGMLEAVVDTDAIEAREWAEDIYERCRAEARPLDADEADALFSSALTA